MRKPPHNSNDPITPSVLILIPSLPSNCCFVLAHSEAFLVTSAMAVASWLFRSASDFRLLVSSSWRELSWAVAELSSVAMVTFSCSRCRTLAWELAVVDLKASFRCSSMELLCSTNLQGRVEEEEREVSSDY